MTYRGDPSLIGRDRSAWLRAIYRKLPPIFLAGTKVEFPIYPFNRRAVAFHEAGHVVLGSVFSLPITSAVVHEKPDDTGEAGKIHMDLEGIQRRAASVDEDKIPHAMLQEAALEIAAMYVAGHLAMLYHYQHRIDGWLDIDDLDYRNARSVLRKAFHSDLPLYFCHRLAQAVLAETWDWVSAIAAVLETKGEIDIGESKIQARELAAIQAELAAQAAPRIFLGGFDGQ